MQCLLLLGPGWVHPQYYQTNKVETVLEPCRTGVDYPFTQLPVLPILFHSLPPTRPRTSWYKKPRLLFIAEDTSLPLSSTLPSKTVVKCRGLSLSALNAKSPIRIIQKEVRKITRKRKIKKRNLQDFLSSPRKGRREERKLTRNLLDLLGPDNCLYFVHESDAWKEVK